jgi:LPS sulfotransferase NodH
LANSGNYREVSDSQLFVVVGAQRTGTNLLRETLNTNEEIAMLGEVLTPSPAPAHWDNFCGNLPTRSALPATRGETEALLDRYFEFVQNRIRNHWQGNEKHHSHAFGVDIKYNQLRQIAPAHWNSSSSPFILGYLRSRGATLIHTTRNVIHCAISSLVASQRSVWHNYDGATIDRAYHVDAEECLAYARTILQNRSAFVEAASSCKIVNCAYEHLIEDIRRAGSGEEIPEAAGPLRDISQALGCQFKFRYERLLKKAINIQYSRALSNFDDLVGRLRDSEFAAFASTLE